MSPAGLALTDTTHKPARLNAAPSFNWQVLPSYAGRKVPLLCRINRWLQTTLIALCSLAVLGYGLDVAATSDTSKMQEQAHRLSEQNTELSAQLLRTISFQGIQDNALGRFGLQVPEQVLMVKEVPPFPITTFNQQKHHLPIMSGY